MSFASSQRSSLGSVACASLASEAGLEEAVLSRASLRRAEDAVVPCNVDARSFLLGQRAALEYAFAEALPARAALGGLQQSVQELGERARTEAAQLQQLHTAGAGFQERLAAAERELERLRGIEAQVVRFAGSLAALEARGDAEPHQALRRRMALSLLWGVEGAGTLLTRLAHALLGECSPPRPTADDGTRRRRALGPFLLLLAAESSFRISRTLPPSLRTLLAPLHRGLRLGRAAAWLAALILAAGASKRKAHDVSDVLAQQLQPLLAALSPRPTPMPLPGGLTPVQAQAQGVMRHLDSPPERSLDFQAGADADHDHSTPLAASPTVTD